MADCSWLPAKCSARNPSSHSRAVMVRLEAKRRRQFRCNRSVPAAVQIASGRSPKASHFKKQRAGQGHIPWRISQAEIPAPDHRSSMLAAGAKRPQEHGYGQTECCRWKDGCSELARTGVVRLLRAGHSNAE